MTGGRGTGAGRLAAALRRPSAEGRMAVVPFITAGYPGMEGFAGLVDRMARVSDALEIGIPFSDPIADGVTIQRASRVALRRGVTLRWTLDRLKAVPRDDDTPTVLMTYLNPLLAFGFDRLAAEARAAGVTGLVVPDLPLEEGGSLAVELLSAGVALVQIVTPETPAGRLRRLCEASRGFVYAVTRTGTTGERLDPGPGLLAYLDRVRAVSPLPVLAGFGIRGPAQVEALRGHADGIIVGSEVVDRLERGRDPVAFIQELRRAGAPARGTS